MNATLNVGNVGWDFVKDVAADGLNWRAFAWVGTYDATPEAFIEVRAASKQAVSEALRVALCRHCRKSPYCIVTNQSGWTLPVGGLAPIPGLPVE